jgi:hypothetical protein
MVSLALKFKKVPRSHLKYIAFKNKDSSGYTKVHVTWPDGKQRTVRLCTAVFVMLLRRNPKMSDNLLRSARQGQTCPLTSQAFFECLYRVDARFVQSLGELLCGI